MFSGQFLSPLIAGPLIAATSYATGFLATALVALTVFSGLLWLRPGATAAERAQESAPESVDTTHLLAARRR